VNVDQAQEFCLAGIRAGTPDVQQFLLVIVVLEIGAVDVLVGTCAGASDDLDGDRIVAVRSRGVAVTGDHNDREDQGHEYSHASEMFLHTASTVTVSLFGQPAKKTSVLTDS